MYLLDRTKLKLGDIILTRSNEKNSSLICKITKSDFSHAILYVGESSYIHSDPYGVHSSNIQRLLIDELHYAKVVRVDDPVAIEKAITYARLQVGTSYSKISAANAFAKVFTKLDAKRQFCSRLVAKAFETAGIDLVANSDACLPQEIADSTFVREIKGCLYQARSEEIEFAHSYDPIKNQTEITNSILKSVRKLMGNKIQSLADITSALIVNPKYDNEVTEIYESSGYPRFQIISATFMDRCRRGSQLLKVVRSSRQRNKQYYHELSAVDRGQKIPDFCSFGTGDFSF
ncbi:hypothetical protein MCX36_20290 [Vibrio aestuarianus]|uniref:YiiX/YebB-like N1pC/P60 family cysteine hydrolase n=2 Tax=Vibrio aestuarianus TaxID=28171 RepID=UPI00237D17FD|nr:YiiX/YebB-like N1pC/P60 family cysteine hydrolase [Vibrio aestuarianus]MDE1312684.1 hypothetical protein [Vibrio aestuarianus]